MSSVKWSDGFFDFEWNVAKDSTNYSKHGNCFQCAAYFWAKTNDEDSQSSPNLASRQKIAKKSALSQEYRAPSGSAKRSKSRSSTLSETKAESSGLSAVTSPKGKIQPESSASATKTCVLQEAKRRTTEVTITFTDDVPYESDDDDDLSDTDDNWVEIPKECYSDFTTYIAFLRSLKK
jgi:hypothetical protein